MGESGSIVASFVAKFQSWGFFSGTAPTQPSEQAAVGLPDNVRDNPELVHVPGLRGTLSFHRNQLESAFGLSSHLVVYAVLPFPREHLAEAVRLLLQQCQEATLSVIVEYRVGRSKALLPDRSSEPRAVAAAIAHSNIVGSWDESNPLVVELNGVSFEVTPELHDGAWNLAVGP